MARDTAEVDVPDLLTGALVDLLAVDQQSCPVPLPAGRLDPGIATTTVSPCRSTR
jgi:hypothetical protein